MLPFEARDVITIGGWAVSGTGRPLALRPRFATGLPWTILRRRANALDEETRGPSGHDPWPGSTSQSWRSGELSGSTAPRSGGCGCLVVGSVGFAPRPGVAHRGSDHQDDAEPDHHIAHGEDVGERDPGGQREDIGQG